jgi:hypothetical protein
MTAVILIFFATPRERQAAAATGMMAGDDG